MSTHTLVRGESYVWTSGGGCFEHLEFELDGYSFHRRWGILGLDEWYEYWVDFRPGTSNIVPTNAHHMNPYDQLNGWLCFKTLGEAYRYLKGE